jgi:hypothetical protein
MIINNATALADVGDGSSKPILISVFDSSDAPKSATSATWSLYDQDGNVVNSRSGIAVASVSTTFVIPILPADNVYNATIDRGVCRRYLKVDTVYTDAYITDGHIIDWWQWDIKKFP